MASNRFELVTNWRLAAAPDRVWTELNLPRDWPDWWRAVKRVIPIAEGDAAGLGAVRRFTWTSVLPTS